MTQSRIVENGPDSIAMQKLSQPACLGPNMWHNTIIVLTFANLAAKKGKYHTDASPQSMQKFFQDEFKASEHAVKKRLIHDVGLSDRFVESIPIVVAGYRTTPQLPDLTTSDGETFYWLSELWLKALSVTKLDAQPALIKLNENRMTLNKQEYEGIDQDTRKALVDRMPLIFAEKGAEIGRRHFPYIPVATFVGTVAGVAFRHYMSWSLLANQGVKNKIVTEDEVKTLKPEGQAHK